MLAQQREQVLEGIDGWIKKCVLWELRIPHDHSQSFDFEDKIKQRLISL